MSDPNDHWMPFRRRGDGLDGSEVSARIRRDVIQPLEALVEKVGHPHAGIPEDSRHSLETVLAVVSESFATTDHAGSVETIDQAWQGWEAKLQGFTRSGGEVSLRRIGKVADLGKEATRQLYLAVREAIGNAMRHAAAGRIEVLMVPWQKGCAVTVADNGQGISPTKAGGIGMSTMRRRMARCDGEVLVHPIDGTVIEFRMPGPRRSLWEWLLASGRIERGVSADHATEIRERWQERIDRFGGLETVFTEWPRAASWIEGRLPAGRRAPDDLASTRDWLTGEIRRTGIEHDLEVDEDADRVRCRISWHGEVDPLHWLEMSLVASLARPVVLKVTGSSGVELIVARRPDHLPAVGVAGSFASLVHNTWAAGLPAARDDLSSYLHDVLAQELVAESMRWEISRESCPPGPLRSRFDQCQHELRRIAVLARGLSHEISGD
ncbi:sensor histidine kinase [Luteolibacter marinus]|uniref:sensor histidine kinase n=1 Tax=Luteolibacter marinus TaxID=2776705 RepID=UPI0018684AFC|nr:ATP-binding protein [Luteolibacter marinus]